MKLTLLELYVQIIEYAKRYKPSIGEKHHPIPRAFSKHIQKHEFTTFLQILYDVSETVLLTCEDHFFVHGLLPKIFPNGTQEQKSMLFAYWMMCITKDGKIINSEEYASVRQTHIENMRIKMSGVANCNKGKNNQNNGLKNDQKH